MVSPIKGGKSGGQSIVFPDVCKTPAPPAPFVPIPYPNIQYAANLKEANATDAQAQAGNKSAKKKQKIAIENYKMAVSVSAGDEAGTLKGVVSASQAVRAGRTVHFSGGSAAVVRSTGRNVFGKK